MVVGFAAVVVQDDTRFRSAGPTSIAGTGASRNDQNDAENTCTTSARASRSRLGR